MKGLEMVGNADEIIDSRKRLAEEGPL